MLRDGARHERVARAMTHTLEADVDEVDYAAVVDPVTFQPAAQAGPWLLIVAAQLGGTRLIDNILVEQEI